MGLKKLLSIIVISFAFFSTVNAQKIEKMKVLLFHFTLAEFPSVTYESVVVTKISNDTTWFNFDHHQYYKAGQKVYMKESTDDVLLFDYSLVKGDSFFRSSFFTMDTFIVDSVYMKKMNHRTFRAWHLSNKHPNCGKDEWEWVEGLGELRTGWNTKCYILSDGGFEIKGICLNDSVIYWDTRYNYFKDRNPGPTCNFDSVSKRLNVKSNIENEVFNFYPNPVSGALNIYSKADGKMSIIDLTGKIWMSEIPLAEGTQTINLFSLRSGVYVLVAQTGNEVVYKKFCVLDN